MNEKNYFLIPTSNKQKQYEALIACFVEDFSAKEVANKFGYTFRAFTSLVADFRKQRKEKQNNELFFQVKKPGRKEMQLDGSHHDWFEERGEKCCLMVMVDDATGRTMALMSEEETTASAMNLLWLWIDRYGIPKALYTDKKNVYLTERDPTIEEELSGQEPLTVFGKGCNKLGIQIIPAHSPQAKGRVERKNGVFQDRLVKELRLRGINDITATNHLLPEFTEKLNTPSLHLSLQVLLIIIRPFLKAYFWQMSSVGKSPGFLPMTGHSGLRPVCSR